MLPVIKIYKMDWNFLIQNYLDPKLWKKEWTLFEYKGFKITISLYQIYTKNEKIYFEIGLSHKEPITDWIITKTKQIDYSLKIDDIDFLKKKINSAIWDLFISGECSWYIEYEDEYQDLLDLDEQEREKLRSIAEEFLDQNDVKNENIREAYIDAYIDEYRKVYDMRQDYRSKRRFNAIPDLYLVWLDSLEKEDQSKRQQFEEGLDQTKIEEIRQEISQYQKQMESFEWEEEMQSKLEEV